MRHGAKALHAGPPSKRAIQDFLLHEVRARALARPSRVCSRAPMPPGPMLPSLGLHGPSTELTRGAARPAQLNVAATAMSRPLGARADFTWLALDERGGRRESATANVGERSAANRDPAAAAKHHNEQGESTPFPGPSTTGPLRDSNAHGLSNGVLPAAQGQDARSAGGAAGALGAPGAAPPTFSLGVTPRETLEAPTYGVTPRETLEARGARERVSPSKGQVHWLDAAAGAASLRDAGVAGETDFDSLVEEPPGEPAVAAEEPLFHGGVVVCPRPLAPAAAWPRVPASASCGPGRRLAAPRAPLRDRRRRGSPSLWTRAAACGCGSCTGTTAETSRARATPCAPCSSRGRMASRRCGPAEPAGPARRAAGRAAEGADLPVQGPVSRVRCWFRADTARE